MELDDCGIPIIREPPRPTAHRFGEFVVPDNSWLKCEIDAERSWTDVRVSRTERDER